MKKKKLFFDPFTGEALIKTCQLPIPEIRVDRSIFISRDNKISSSKNKTYSITVKSTVSYSATKLAN